MKHKSGIYRIINKINGKSYFGQSKDLRNRWIRHKHYLNKNKHQNKHLQRSFNKYGEDAFIFTIHLYCSIEDLDREEQIVLDICKAVPELFYNISYDAEHSNRGTKRSEETKQKMSNSQKALYENGYINPMLGKPCSEEQKKKMSLAKIGRTHSEEHKKKISLAGKGKHHSEETKKKISLSNMGEKNHQYDNKIYHFYNEKLNIRENCNQFELRNKYKLNQGNLCSVINGKYKSCKGWVIINE